MSIFFSFQINNLEPKKIKKPNLKNKTWKGEKNPRPISKKTHITNFKNSNKKQSKTSITHWF